MTRRFPRLTEESRFCRNGHHATYLTSAGLWVTAFIAGILIAAFIGLFSGELIDAWQIFISVL